TLDLIIKNPNTYEQYTQELYSVDARVYAKGLFSDYKLDPKCKDKDVDILGVDEKSIYWDFYAPALPTETTTTVTIRADVKKKVTFPVKILFADSTYLTGQEIAGTPIPPSPKTMYFSDNFITMKVDLNRRPPIVSGTAYANVLFTPKVDGILDVTDMATSSGRCETDDDPNSYVTSYHCEFDGDSDSLTEELFGVTVEYNFTKYLEYTFTIMPGGEPTGTRSTTPSRPGTPSTPSTPSTPTTPTTPTPGATYSVTACGSSCSPACGALTRTGAIYTSCSDPHLAPYLTSGCRITLSNGAVCP
ncbi:MAG: hypothetical protein ACP5E4_04865, partial [Candidatus Aenigmatarchaeota archaeon]